MTSLFAGRVEPGSAGHREVEASQEDLQVWAQLELSRLAGMALTQQPHAVVGNCPPSALHLQKRD